jgi:hypothetical protein
MQFHRQVLAVFAWLCLFLDCAPGQNFNPHFAARKVEKGDKMTGFTQVDNEIVERAAEIGPTAFLVYAVLVKHVDNESQTCYPSATRLARSTGLTVRTIRKAIKTLESHKLISIKQRRNEKNAGFASNIYTILSPHKPSEPKAPTPSEPKAPRVVNETTLPLVNETTQELDPLRTRPNRTKCAVNSFDAFWGLVPSHKKSGKRKAEEAYQVALRRLNGKHPNPAAFLLDRASAYYASPLGQTCFCNGPAPFLNQGQYDDDPKAWNRDGNGKVNAVAKPQASINYFQVNK